MLLLIQIVIATSLVNETKQGTNIKTSMLGGFKLRSTDAVSIR